MVKCYYQALLRTSSISVSISMSVKRWSRCISMAIAKTASRNVAFKVARTRMRQSIMEGQDELIIRKSDTKEVALEDDNQDVLDDLGYNADLYIQYQYYQAPP